MKIAISRLLCGNVWPKTATIIDIEKSFGSPLLLKCMLNRNLTVLLVFIYCY